MRMFQCHPLGQFFFLKTSLTCTDKTQITLNSKLNKPFMYDNNYFDWGNIGKQALSKLPWNGLYRTLSCEEGPTWGRKDYLNKHGNILWATVGHNLSLS